MLVIVVQGKGVDPQRFEFDQHEVTVGRAEVNDIVLPVSNISKRHAHIRRTKGGVVVSDRRSTNGTYVNGRRLLLPMRIDDADRIHIGDFILAVTEVAGSAQSPRRERRAAGDREEQGEDPGEQAGEVGLSSLSVKEAHPGLLPRMPWLDDWSGGTGTDPVLRDPFSLERSGGPGAPPPVHASVIVSLPALVAPGEVATLRVMADARQSAAETDEGAEEAWRCRRGGVLEVLLSLPDGGFQPLGGQEGVLRISRAERSPELSFPLRARDPGAARVEIGISHRGARLATLLLRPEVRPDPVGPPGSEDDRRGALPAGGAGGPKNPVVASLPVEPIAPGLGPRFVLRVREGGVGTYRSGGRALRVEFLHVPGETAEGLAEGEVDIEAPLQEVMRGIYLSPEVEGIGRLTSAVREAALRAFGEGLSARLLPPSVREAMEGLAAGSLLQVDATCPWVPWEAVRIGRGSGAAYLGERFALSRGGQGSYTGRFARAPRLLVCPPGAAVRLEQRALAALDPRLTRVQRFADLRPYLRDEPLAGWHITGHDGFERGDRAAAALQLEDGVFTPTQVAPAARFLRLGMTPPLRGAFILLSICETAPSGPLLPAGAAMWVERLLSAGAGAVVATTWPVSNHKAALFAEAFYRAWAAQRPLAVAVAEAREAIREEGDPAWLSYAVFGLPGARLLEG